MTPAEHGGKRAGAGRPKSGTPTRKISLRLSGDNYARLKGVSNLSARINQILARFFREAGPRG